METRTINIQLVEQVQKQRIVKFMPVRLTAADSDVLLKQHYSVRVDADGSATIALPVRSSGTITYQYEMPAVNGVSKGKFNLEAGASIDLADLIEGSPEASDSIQQYIDGKIAEVKPYRVYIGRVTFDGVDEYTAVAKQNDFDNAPTFTYNGTGLFTITGLSWDENEQVDVRFGHTSAIGVSDLVYVNRFPSRIEIETYVWDGSDYVQSDDVWGGRTIEIRVYDE